MRLAEGMSETKIRECLAECGCTIAVGYVGDDGDGGLMIMRYGKTKLEALEALTRDMQRCMKLSVWLYFEVSL